MKDADHPAAALGPLELTTDGETATETLGHRIGAAIEFPCTLALIGPLGAGKTCFTRGLATGLGIDPDDIASPTFVYMVEYPEGRLPLVHADLYRLGELTEDAAPQVFEEIGLAGAIDSEAVVVVEWFEHYRGSAPERLLRVEFEIETVETRAITLSFSGAGWTADIESLRSAVADA